MVLVEVTGLPVPGVGSPKLPVSVSVTVSPLNTPASVPVREAEALPS